jgi:galactosylceramidase
LATANGSQLSEWTYPTRGPPNQGSLAYRHWGYAHYGQFSKVGWQYLNGACGKLSDGGTFVTLKSSGEDYSVIVETKNATNVQNLTCDISGGLSTRKLCIWRSDAAEQFVQQPHITPKNRSFTIALEPKSIYSISTTTGH